MPPVTIATSYYCHELLLQQVTIATSYYCTSYYCNKLLLPQVTIATSYYCNKLLLPPVTIATSYYCHKLLLHQLLLHQLLLTQAPTVPLDRSRVDRWSLFDEASDGATFTGSVTHSPRSSQRTEQAASTCLVLP